LAESGTEKQTVTGSFLTQEDMRVLVLLALVCFCAISAQKDAPPPSIMSVGGQFRDFWPCSNPRFCGQYAPTPFNCTLKGYKCHPDFQRYNGEDKNIVGMYLGSDGLPVFDGTRNHPSVSGPDSVYLWYHDQWPNGTKTMNSMYYAMDVNLTQVDPGCNSTAKPFCDRVYQGIFPTFFRLDGMGFGNYYTDTGGNSGHNYHYTLAIVSLFQYQGGEVFNFTGDDDVWVYINGKRVVDLGGVHSPLSTSVKMDDLGLIKGRGYDFRIFYQERHTSQSNFKMTTTLALQCPYADHCGICGGDGQSCCACTTDDKCLTAKCDVLPPGTCRTSPIVCDKSQDNQCFTTSCGSSDGCRQRPTVCDKGDPCMDYFCLNSTGCFSRPKTDNDPCTIDTCTPTGMKYSLKCNNVSDLCTQRSCDKNGNCLSSTKQCPDSNCKINGKCDTNTGSCVYSDRQCADVSPCEPSTGCDANIGCTTKKVQCSTTKECYTSFCDATGKCSERFASGDTCKSCAANCTSDPCNTRVCDYSTGSCIVTPVCPDLNKCTPQKCNPDAPLATRCSANPTNCVGAPGTDTCRPPTCDLATGKCIAKPNPCIDSSPCTKDICTVTSSTTFKCDNSPTCPSTFCNQTTCDEKSGKCNYTAPVCDSGNLCLPSFCNKTSQQCEQAPIRCDDGLDCTDDTCNPLDGKCVFTNNCDDNDLCTSDTCDPVNGTCVFDNLPLPYNASLPCDLWYCDRLLGNRSTPLVCYPTDKCSCHVTNGCECNGGLGIGAIAGIASGAVAGIAIGAAAGAAALGFGAKKGYDYMQASSMAQADIHNNPLHVPKGGEMANPIYEQTASAV